MWQTEFLDTARIEVRKVRAQAIAAQFGDKPIGLTMGVGEWEVASMSNVFTTGHVPRRERCH